MERIGNSRGVGGSKTQEIPEVRGVGWGVNNIPSAQFLVALLTSESQFQGLILHHGENWKFLRGGGFEDPRNSRGEEGWLGCQ